MFNQKLTYYFFLLYHHLNNWRGGHRNTILLLQKVQTLLLNQLNLKLLAPQPDMKVVRKDRVYYPVIFRKLRKENKQKDEKLRPWRQQNTLTGLKHPGMWSHIQVSSQISHWSTYLSQAALLL